MNNQPQVIFLCGARDFHAMDWYTSSIVLGLTPRPIILTDLIMGEGFKILITPEDKVYNLIILDQFLFRKQSRLAHLWRNIIKALVFPFQALMVARVSRKFKNHIFYAHSMYYIWLAWASRVNFIATPQGSDILLKPFNSSIFKFLSRLSMRSALFVTVDSIKMAKGVHYISGVTPIVLQNGIDTVLISSILDSTPRTVDKFESRIISFRGLSTLYRIKSILLARNSSRGHSHLGINFIYPFSDKEYADKCKIYSSKHDIFIGRVNRNAMYSFFSCSLLCISIPSSDSSPRSVYEAIFCGAIVAVSMEDYICDLPECMRNRLVVVDVRNPDWFDLAVDQASVLKRDSFVPCSEALERFDQVESFRSLYQLSLNALK